MYISKGNRKLSKAVAIWNLPRLVTCPGAGACKDWCYEIKIERMYNGTKPCRATNLMDTLKQNFVTVMVEKLKCHKGKYVRVHESGDFYSQKYLDKWYAIARQMPEKRFYAYTKSLHLDLWTYKPKNFNILQSSGGRYDARIKWHLATFRAIPKQEQPRKTEYVCPYSAMQNDGGCGDTCIVCMERPNAHVTIQQHY